MGLDDIFFGKSLKEADFKELIELSKDIAFILGFTFEVNENEPCLTLKNFFESLYRFLGGKK